MKLHHVALTVKNIEESQDFYSSLFGFQEVKSFERPDLGGKAVLLTCDNINLEIWEFSKNEDISYEGKKLQELGIAHIAFQIDSIEDFLTKNSLTFSR